MPTIKPISDLRNYPEIVAEVHEDSPVYLTKNGKGAYAIVDIEDIQKMETLKNELNFLKMMFEAESESNLDGWIDFDSIKKEFGFTK